MNWEETVMSIDDLLKSGIDFNKPLQVWLKQSFKHQAKISFNLGMETGNQKAYEIGVSDGKVGGIAEGIREVVEWLEQYCPGSQIFKTTTGQAKLKEWGLE